MNSQKVVKRKKRKWSFKPSKTKDSFVNNPKTGTPVFGVIPEIDHENASLPEGEVFLRYGEHIGANRGFGVAHIWAEHKQDLKRLGHDSEEGVAHFVSDIVVSGALLYTEMAGSINVAVLQNDIGLAILEQRADGKGKPYYSVVTAYIKREAHGTLIGSVR